MATDGLRWFCDRFGPALRDGGFRPRSIELIYFEDEELAALLRQPLIRDCPALESFSSYSLPSDAVVEWLHRPSAEENGERIMLLTYAYSAQQLIAPLKSVHSFSLTLFQLPTIIKAFASAQAPGDARPYTLLLDLTYTEEGTPFRLENHDSGEALVYERLTRDHFRIEDLHSDYVQEMCNRNSYSVLHRGCLVGPHLLLNWRPFEGDQVIDLTI